MIKLNLNEKQLAELHNEAMNNNNVRARKRCWVVYLRGKGLAGKEVADLVKVNVDSVTNYVRKYAEGGLPKLLEENFYKPRGRMDDYEEELKKLFEEHPPHTVNEAIELIEKETGIRLPNSTCREVLRKLGLRLRRCGLVPGKVLDDKKHQQKQEEFHNNELQPRLEEAKSRSRIILFVDAAHFVMGSFLGLVWCFARVFLPSSSGRQRYNVLGAYDPIQQRVITLTNSTVVNQETFCSLMEKIAEEYAQTGLPITLVLDNARYQKCKSVFEKAEELKIELLYLPPYSPNLNLIERLWKFIKKKVLYSRYYEKFESFKQSIDTCIDELGTRFKNEIETLMSLKFQLFTKSEKLTV